jgi:hypothetical protein
MKQQILKLRAEGKSYTEISTSIPCALSTVWYYCTEGAKQKRNSYKRRDNKQFRFKLKTLFGGKCSICNYNRCLEALDFHHKNPNEKDLDVSQLANQSKQRAIAEANKCILVCSNCHDEIHAGLISIGAT